MFVKLVTTDATKFVVKDSHETAFDTSALFVYRDISQQMAVFNSGASGISLKGSVNTPNGVMIVIPQILSTTTLDALGLVLQFNINDYPGHTGADSG